MKSPSDSSATLPRNQSVRFPLDPRLVPPEKVARRLGLTTARFASVLPELEAIGFPRPLAVLGNYSLEAVDSWIDAKSGLTKGTEVLSDGATIDARLRTKGWER